MKRQDEYHEDYMQRTRYVEALGDIPEGLTYDEIHEALIVRQPYIARHEPTHRNFEESGVNALLDQLNHLLLGQCLETLEVEANNGQLQ